MTSPTKHHEGNGGNMVDKHLPKILKTIFEQSTPLEKKNLDHLPFHINKLGEEERPVECQFDHVIPPAMQYSQSHHGTMS